jgi:hypothetical protein
VWQINRKPGVPPGRILTYGTGFDHDDLLVGAIF